MKLLNKKGFTLIELLGVLTIMSIIGVIAVVSIDGMMEEAQKTECESVVVNLKNATKEYVSDKRFDITNSGVYEVKVDKLITNGYLTKKITNPFTKEDVTDNEDKSEEYNIKREIINVVLNNDYTVKTITIDFIDCANGKFGN